MGSPITNFDIICYQFLIITHQFNIKHLITYIYRNIYHSVEYLGCIHSAHITHTHRHTLTHAHTCIHAFCAHGYTHYTNTQVHTHIIIMCTHMHTRTRTHTYTCMHIHIHTCIHMYTHACTHIHIETHTNTCTHMCIHSHPYMYKPQSYFCDTPELSCLFVV